MNNINHKDLNSEREKAIEKIMRWLREEGHIIQRENRSEYYYFGKVVLPETQTDEEDAFYINIPKSSTDKIIVEKAVGFTKLDKTSFYNLSEYEQNDFIFKLKKDLHRTNIEFSFLELTTVKLKKIIFFDGLSKTSLFDAIMSIFSADRITNIVYGELSDKLNQK